jgi:hypothetical protein
MHDQQVKLVAQAHQHLYTGLSPVLFHTVTCPEGLGGRVCTQGVWVGGCARRGSGWEGVHAGGLGRRVCTQGVWAGGCAHREHNYCVTHSHKGKPNAMTRSTVKGHIFLCG